MVPKTPAPPAQANMRAHTQNEKSNKTDEPVDICTGVLNSPILTADPSMIPAEFDSSALIFQNADISSQE